MKTAEIITWIATPSDGRFTASATASADVPQKDAFKLAKSLANDADPLSYADSFNLKPAQEFASGHPVIIRYESGRKRCIRSDY